MKNEQDMKTIQAMMRFGGSFVKALGEAAMRADDINLAKIKRAFHGYWCQYQNWGKKTPFACDQCMTYDECKQE